MSIEMAGTSITLSAAPVEQWSQTEAEIARIWTAALDMEPSSRTDTFVDLGGTSLTAVQCIADIRSAFDVDLPLLMLFSDTATIAELARVVDRIAREKCFREWVLNSGTV